jgi:hypothetical protein
MDWVTKMGRNFNLLLDQGWSHLRSSFNVDCEGESKSGSFSEHEWWRRLRTYSESLHLSYYDER